ncbi:hypothetical protein OAS25_02890 [Alphaproteobacteria bacterium]|nr:hypothetical protein [Alphaproteobacteria bacterium]
MEFKLYHQFKTFKVLVAILILIVAIFNFFKKDDDNRLIYLIKFSETNEDLLVFKDKEDKKLKFNDHFIKNINTKFNSLFYYQNISSKNYLITRQNKEIKILEFINQYYDTYYNHQHSRKNKQESVLDRPLSKDELDKIYARDIYSSLIKFDTDEIIDKKIQQSPKFEFLIEMHAQYPLNNLILLVLLIFISLFYIFLVVRKS